MILPMYNTIIQSANLIKSELIVKIQLDLDYCNVSATLKRSSKLVQTGKAHLLRLLLFQV